MVVVYLLRPLDPPSRCLSQTFLGIGILNPKLREEIMRIPRAPAGKVLVKRTAPGCPANPKSDPGGLRVGLPWGPQYQGLRQLRHFRTNAGWWGLLMTGGGGGGNLGSHAYPIGFRVKVETEKCMTAQSQPSLRQ